MYVDVGLPRGPLWLGEGLSDRSGVDSPNVMRITNILFAYFGECKLWRIRLRMQAFLLE